MSRTCAASHETSDVEAIGRDRHPPTVPVGPIAAGDAHCHITALRLGLVADRASAPRRLRSGNGIATIPFWPSCSDYGICGRFNQVAPTAGILPIRNTDPDHVEVT